MIVELLAVAAGLGLAAGLGAAWAAQARENRRAILRRILGRVQGTLVSGALADEVVGTQDGRAFRLRLGTRKGLRAPGGPGSGRPGGLTDVFPIEVELSLAHAPPVRLRVRRDEGLASVEKALGLVEDVEVAGGEKFDRTFLVEADGEPLALSSKEVRRAIELLLGRWSLDELVIADGALVARGAPELVGQKQLQGLLTALEVLAHAFDRRPAIEIGLSSPLGFAWIGGAGATARCPFCHDGLESPDGLVECERCRTLIHGDCHQENQGCPIIGCGARGAERAGPDPKREGGLDLA